MAVMMVRIAYHNSAIPLIWRAHTVTDYPEEGQVALMNALLAQLQVYIPADQSALLLSDRGPQLVQADGEVIGHTPVEVQIAKKVLHGIMPKPTPAAAAG